MSCGFENVSYLELNSKKCIIIKSLHEVQCRVMLGNLMKSLPQSHRLKGKQLVRILGLNSRCKMNGKLNPRSSSAAGRKREQKISIDDGTLHDLVHPARIVICKHQARSDGVLCENESTYLKSCGCRRCQEVILGALCNAIFFCVVHCVA